MARKLFTLGIVVAAFGLLVIGGSGTAADNPVVVGGYCPDGCGHKVCRPTVETKKVAKRVFSDTCEDFCLPRCSLLRGLFGRGCCADDGCCAGGKCGRVRTKKYLVVKTREHEECVNKCVVEDQGCAGALPCVAPVPARTAQTVGGDRLQYQQLPTGKQ